MKKLSGVYTAIITPFDKEGKLDELGLRKNIQFQIKNGVDGIVALGTTGESPTLDEAEKELVIKIAREETKGKTVLIVGTGSYSTQHAIHNSKRALQLGADYALVVTPYYNKPTQEGLYLHFKAISEATSLPMIIYNIQGRTGQNIQTETLKRLAKLPNIIGIKESSGNIAQIQEVIYSIKNERPEFCVLSGDDYITLPLIAMGGDGVISVVSNLCPALVKQMTTAALAGDFAKARKIHYELTPIFVGAFIETNPMPIKAAMNHVGMSAGGCRLPLCDLQPDNHRKLVASLSNYK